MMDVLVILCSLINIFFGFTAIVVSLACYMFVWTANGKHEVKPALIFGTSSIIGLVLIYIGAAAL